jgi:hypothetical protein
MEYTVYTLGREVLIAEAQGTAPALPAGAVSRLVTTDQDEAVTATGQLVLAGYRWAGNDWLAPAEFHCNRCGLPAEPNGQGGWRHVEPADEAACSLISGGGMLAALLEE